MAGVFFYQVLAYIFLWDPYGSKKTNLVFWYQFLDPHMVAWHLVFLKYWGNKPGSLFCSRSKGEPDSLA